MSKKTILPYNIVIQSVFSRLIQVCLTRRGIVITLAYLLIISGCFGKGTDKNSVSNSGYRYERVNDEATAIKIAKDQYLSDSTGPGTGPSRSRLRDHPEEFRIKTEKCKTVWYVTIYWDLPYNKDFDNRMGNTYLISGTTGEVLERMMMQ